MIKSIKVTNYIGDTITLELGKPQDSGLLIYNVEGIGPPKADINTTNVATVDGSIFNSARATERNIVVSMKYLFDPMVEDARHKSYKYFPVKKQVKLEFLTDRRECEIYGYVESNSPNIFSSQEYTQISIICPDPYFYALKKSLTTFYGIIPRFYFPFSNKSLTKKKLVMGEIRINKSQTVYYEGDAEVGVTMYIHAIGYAENITIYKLDTREIMAIDTNKIEKITGAPFGTGDEIIISTVSRQKYIRLLRGGRYTNIINALDKNADWFQLQKGDNVFAYTAEYGEDNLQFRIENQVVYEGV